MKLEIKNINKSFGDKQVLHDITFTVESGRAMGFLGRNGAGKTTTIRTLMDIFKPDSGEFLVDGQKFDRNKFKIGYLPEERGMYQKINILEQLIYFGKLKGMNKEDAKNSALSLLDLVELKEYANKKLETLSKGNQQKVQIIQAILDDPDIVIFDEPFSGLDPVNAKVLKNIIQNYIQKNRIVLFSSHQMSTVEEFCDNITFIKQGKIKLSDSLKNVKYQLGRKKYLLSTDDINAFDKLKNIEYISNTSTFKDYILIETQDEILDNKLINDIVKNDINIISFNPYRPSLEDIFVKMDKELWYEANIYSF